MFGDFVVFLFQVYTINDESIYLLIFGVPKIDLRSELKKLCQRYGEVSSIAATLDYPCPQFTECFKVKYGKLPAARVAKKMLDDKNYYGSVLHVCYAPEFETVEETRNKLTFRRFHTARKLRQIEAQKEIDYRNSVIRELNPISSAPSTSSAPEDPKVYVFKDRKRPKCDISALRKKTRGFLVTKSEIDELLKQNENGSSKPKIENSM